MQKLIKLNESHYIVIDDSEIKEGDWIFRLEKVYQFKDDMPVYNPKASKITHSTQPLEKIGTVGDKEFYGFDVIKHISQSEVEEAINGYSVDDLAFEAFKKQDEWTWSQFKDIFPYGFNAHKELVKDKLFTVEQVNKVREMLVQGALTGMSCSSAIVEFDRIIQSLLLKTEWEVEFDEQGKIKLI